MKDQAKVNLHLPQNVIYKISDRGSLWCIELLQRLYKQNINLFPLVDITLPKYEKEYTIEEEEFLTLDPKDRNCRIIVYKGTEYRLICTDFMYLRSQPDILKVLEDYDGHYKKDYMIKYIPAGYTYTVDYCEGHGENINIIIDNEAILKDLIELVKIMTNLTQITIRQAFLSPLTAGILSDKRIIVQTLETYPHYTCFPTAPSVFKCTFPGAVDLD